MTLKAGDEVYVSHMFGYPEIDDYNYCSTGEVTYWLFDFLDPDNPHDIIRAQRPTNRWNRQRQGE